MDAIDVVNTTSHIGHGHRRPKIITIENQPISDLTGFGALILTVVLCLLFLMRHYLFEGFLFKRFYGSKYFSMDDTARRGFMNHHVGAVIKIIVIVVGAYPWVHVLFGSAQFDTPLSKGSHMSMGDLLLVVTEIFTSMYLFELLFRTKLSPIAVAHHIGAIIIGQTAVVLGLDARQRDASMEYMLCLIWGAFDVLAELWPNIAIILYRVYPDNHYFLQNVFLGTSAITVMGTTAETIMIAYMLAKSWSEWELSFKIVTPILHCVFMLAQIHGSRILYALYMKERRKLSEEERQLTDVETGTAKSKGKKTVDEDEIKSAPMVTATSVITSSSGDEPASQTNDSEAQLQPKKSTRFQFLSRLPKRPWS